MPAVEQLVQQVADARNRYLHSISHITEEQASYKPSENEWSIIDNTEHLFWAEQGALFGMWKILYAIRNGSAVRTYASSHRNWSAEKIVEHTWKEKEQVPAIAAPRLGGTIAFWRAALSSLQHILNQFAKDIKEEELRLLAHPHPISGDMDFHQRLEFLVFHINRHQTQVQNIIATFKTLS
ncbi:MAG: DinB family protein [Bacteroidetes bacterium]|nr:DinB family protein [Bacteroidota bacterium]